ncbi:NAD(P)H-binding protein [uncultured Reyranella sp.]|uniref:NAD(P)H-binding protein n=1 Tax=uncultured Reyranella sp. TaxID=735512 RepID=UPI0025E118F2|nr:NAD(P)H-binding protein [uncultured Reyranella sp.]
MFVIMGATGKVGGAALETLKQRGTALRAVVRDPARAQGLGVETVRGDASETESLAAAFTGAEAAFVMLVPPYQAQDVVAQSRVMARSIAAAVRAAGVPHVVALSSVGAHLHEGNGIVQVLHDFEAALADAAPSLVFLRPGEFLENWAAMLPVAREAGVLPSGKLALDKRHEAVSALDVGRVAADLLLDPRPGTRIVDLAGPAPYSALDAAAVLSRLLGKPVTAVPSSREQSVAALVAAGLGADYAAKLAELDEAINAGRLDFPPSDDLRRGTVTLDAVLQRLVGGG